MFPFLLLRSVMKGSTRTSNKIMWDYIAFPNGAKHKTTNHKTNFIPSVDNDESTHSIYPKFGNAREKLM